MKSTNSRSKPRAKNLWGMLQIFKRTRQHHRRAIRRGAEVNKLDQDIEDQTKAQAKLQKQIQHQDGKLQQVAAFEEQIAELTRDYDSLRITTVSCKKRNFPPGWQANWRSRAPANGSRLWNAAVPPESPYGPQRTIMIFEGVFLGLLCGIYRCLPR